MIHRIYLLFILIGFPSIVYSSTDIYFERFKPKACTHEQKNGDLVFNIDNNRIDLSDAALTCTKEVVNNKWFYHIEYDGYDFNYDDINDKLDLTVKVQAFMDSTVAYTKTDNDSFVKLGKRSIVNDINNNWSVGNHVIKNQESLQFSIIDAKLSLNDYYVNDNRFIKAKLVEPDAGYEHKYIIGTGSNLVSGEFRKPRKTIKLDSKLATITGAGSSSIKKDFAIHNINFKLTIMSRNEEIIDSNLSDYSSYPSGSTFSKAYPEQDRESTHYPSFSWDHIPRWLAVRKATSFTNEEVLSISNYDIVMLEKSNHQGLKTVDAGILDAATRLKQINENLTTLFYFNARVHYTDYSFDQEFEDNKWDWSKKVTDNNNVESIFMFKDRYYYHEFTSPGMRAWWAKSVLDTVSHPQIDGLFIDAIAKTPKEDLNNPLFVNGKPNTDFALLVDDVAKNLPGDKLFIGNTLRAETNNGSRSHLKYQDGSYLERWTIPMKGTSPKMSSADAISLSIQLMREASSKGKVIMLQSSPVTDDPIPNSLVEKKAYLAKHVDFPLAVFLIAAGENSFFSYQLGVSADEKVQDIWNSDYIPQLNRPLGQPLTEPKQTGFIYERKFEFVDVWVDVEKKIARLTWK
ncbi:putative glycoside hydrolase [Moritella viscosa]|uniref:Glycosyl hydrolase-like 10 domain-containing protein n=1 Tax=Moritella viscosa TaxID=80854 RepID=A0ABY1HJI9_9GAMM|nr:putative glycoside hydrolase [Moritella viscosa]SGY92752.1 Putative uncharacterized protein [Moritella viscosa]SGZ02443.1 Putative uncharacterized protein [Moritella viscosa]SHO25307.1 Putative uncharacterized protein [Moritella viscosa]